MKFINLRNLPHKTVRLGIAFIISSLPILVSCSDNHDSADQSSLPTDTESFTFFDLGKTIKLTKGVRSDLNNKLGRDAIERRSILDLEINYRGFLKRHFPELAALNQKLNSPPGERVEHNTVKLMYRYAQKRNVPFSLVELVFSDYTKTPILFKINFKVDEANTVETLQEKYGLPEVIDWKEENGKSLFWKKNGDILIVSRIPDRFGNIDHQIVIYYTDNLKLLNNTERREKEEQEQQRAKTGKKAF
ncbi:hypothetical protein D1BOALGB6SA_10113 [Olavius sp. associated proteobacterium Delta 1]|nr:hypothetical protein D1BOALGB6SA_10113 [Olavius sp. associated proteobacterium Delta 1]